MKNNAGGVKAEDLALLLSPGKTTNELSDNVIGYFGVGAKRAVIALGADVTIKTRFKNQETCKIHFNDDWINDVEEWEIPYELLKKGIANDTTIIELLKLRFPVNSGDIQQLKTHLAEVYAYFIEEGINIQVNGEKITSILFNNEWSYPKGFEPTSFSDKIAIDDREVEVEILTGLINHSGDPDNSYGIFFYCNNRMIAKGLTDFSVGFEPGKVGNPHYNISLIRTIVKLNGQSRDMPWNSSKSGIDTKHPIFQKLRTSIVTLTSNYAKISRSLQGKWDEEIFPYKEGEIIQKAGVSVEDIPKSLLPKPPASKPRWSQRTIKANRRVINKKVWAEGLQDSIIAAVSIYKMPLTQKKQNSINYSG